MNDTKKWDVETCISGLTEIVLDVLAKEEVKHPGEYVKLKDIREKSGIKDKLATVESESSLEHMFTSKILEHLLREERVEKNTKRRGYWKITDKGLQKHQMDTTQEWDLETCIHGLAETVLDVLVETGKGGDYTRLKEIADKSGIEDKLARVESEPKFGHAFTSTLLMYLLRERRVEKSLTRPGQWKIIDSEYQKRRT